MPTGMRVSPRRPPLPPTLRRQIEDILGLARLVCSADLAEIVLYDPRRLFRVGQFRPGTRHRAAAAAAVLGSWGQTLGTLEVVAWVPRRFDEDQAAALRHLGRLAGTALDVHRTLTTGNVEGGAPATPSACRVGTVAEAERHAIVAALRDTGNNISASAGILQIGRTTLYRKILEYGLGPIPRPRHTR